MSRARRAFAAVLRNRDLRRVEAAFALFLAAELGTWVAILVYAYRQGGATEAGIVAAVQLVPSALLAPVLGALADRGHGPSALLLGYAAQSATLAATGAALLLGAPSPVVYALAALAAAAITSTRPTQALVTPLLARSPLELGAANVLSGWITATMALAAPALVGVVLTLGGPGTAFVCGAAATTAAAALVALVPRGHAAGEAAPLAALRAELAEGFASIRDGRSIRLLIAFIGAVAVLVGAVDVLAVTLALGELGLGAGGPGYLTAAFGAGGVAGAAAGVALVGRRRLVPHLAGAALACGLSFVVLGIRPGVAAAFLLLALAGAGAILFDVAARTLLQRAVPSDVLSRVFGVAEGLTDLGLAAGSLAVPVLVALGGTRAALLGVGALLPVLVLLRLRALLAIDDDATVPVVEIGLLRSMAMFSLLPAPALEGLARALVPVDVPAGMDVVVEGEEGDHFFAIADGRLEVRAHGRVVGTLSRGDGFGEIALLRDVPRTATVTAVVPASLYALERDAFLVALTGHAATRDALRALAARRLEELEQLEAAPSGR